MSNEPPECCPRCGAALSAVEPPTAHYCDACDAPVFYNPTPVARIVVVDGNAVLLNEIHLPGRSLWCVPGGKVGVGEDPDETAARELEEETTLSVEPADLELFDLVTFRKFEASHQTVAYYAVPYSVVEGTPAPGEDPHDDWSWDDDVPASVRFWTPAELAASDASLTDETPENYGDVESLLAAASSAL